MKIGDFLYNHEMDILLSHVIQTPKEYLFSHPEQILTPVQLKKLRQYMQRRKAGEPIAYITGHKEFYGLNFMVTPAVLIPRPDTELLVNAVLQYLGKNTPRRVPTLCDVGTGSGNIAVTIKKYFPNCTMLASDVSAAALKIARNNAKLNNTIISFYLSDVLQNIPKKYHQKINILIFNAPYLTKTEAKKHNLAHEPQVALTPQGTNSSPTSLIEQLLQQAAKYLAPQGKIFLEIGHRQGQQVAKLCKHYFPQSQITIKQDLGKYDRLVICTT